MKKSLCLFETVLLAWCGSLLCAGQPLVRVDKPQAGATSGRPLLKPTGPYRLSSGDVIEIKFFFNPELNDTVQIRPDGKISMPFVGEVEVVGKAIEETVKSLEQLYAKELKNPRIWIQVRSYAAQKVYVTGEVNRPGTQALVGELTLLDAVSDAGGIRHTGSKKSLILIRRGQEGNAVVHKIPFWVDGKPSQEAMTLLRPYDVVMIPESKTARVDRWVDQTIRQMSPAVLSMGFSYLFNVKTAGTSVPGVVF